MAYDSEYQRKYRIENKERLKAHYKRYYAEKKKLYIERAKKYYRDNTETRKEQIKIWALNNKEAVNRYHAKGRERHKDSYNIMTKDWAKRNPGKRSAALANRRANLKNAVPKWLSKAQKKEIIQIYENRPKGHHIDHIVPLVSKHVCGLHVPWNLRSIPAQENYKKSNKLGTF